MRQLLSKAPTPLKVVHADLMHRLRWRRSPAARITRKFVDHHGLAVQDGPFRGMRYPRFAVGRGELVVAQLLGAYERELQPAITRVIEQRYDVIVDIGASDGYYAVGLALASPPSTVYAYEMNPFPARVCRALAEENGATDRVVMRGECRVDDLRALPNGPRTFVLCDCEGGELELMDPSAVPLLRRSALIVELHVQIVPGIEQMIVERFAPSHEIEIVETQCRYIAEYPRLLEVPGVSYIDRELGLSEFRPNPMKWAVMWPRVGRQST